MDYSLAVNDYIERLKDDKNQAERAWKAAKEEQTKAQKNYEQQSLKESLLKGYKENFHDSTNMLGQKTDDSLSRAIELSDKVKTNTGLARDGVRSLTIELSDVAKKTELLLQKLKDYKIKVAEIKAGSTGNVAKVIDTAIATLSQKGVLDMTLEALRTTLSAYQGMETLSGNLGGEQGFHEALKSVKEEISESDLPFLIKKPPKKSGTPPPQTQSSSEKSCPFDADVCLYDSQLITEYTNVQTDRQAAYSTLNGATERRNLTEARYNACKAAYEAAEAARKG